MSRQNENTKNLEKTSNAASNDQIRQRRKFIKAAIMAVPVIMTLSAGTAQAGVYGVSGATSAPTVQTFNSIGDTNGSVSNSTGTIN